MEPVIMPFHSSSPPPLDGDANPCVESELDEFGDFSCSSVDLADAAEPSTLSKSLCSAVKSDPHQPNPSSNHSAEQSQPTAQSDGKAFSSESSLHFTNGYSVEDLESGASVAEETGFADFTVFTEQLSHPWCCGFTEQWDDKAGGANSIVDSSKPGQEVIMESEPRSQHENKADGDVHTDVKHCEQKDEVAQPSQERHQPQEASAAFGPEEDPGAPSDSQRERRSSCDSLENAPQSFLYGSTSDIASFSDDFSFEGISADLEPNVSSLGSQDDQTDCDQTDDEQEELANYRLSVCFVSGSMTNLSLPESENDFYPCSNYATQETPATSNQSQSSTNKPDQSADNDGIHLDRDPVGVADEGVESLGNLPPSDSFADFCSAPAQEDAEGLWAEFKEQSAQVEEKPWTKLSEPKSSLQTDDDDDEEEDASEDNEAICQASVSRRVQQLIVSSFPEVEVTSAEGEEQLFIFSTLLQNQQLPESEEETAELSQAQRMQQVMLGPHQDVHSSVGLQFQWGGSHSNRTLLRCLGVDAKNIVFIGKKKQPVTVPAYASGLGMLEPIKDSVPAVGSPKHSAASASPLENPNTSHSEQEDLSSSSPDWTSRGLSSSQDASLDFFGPEEESSSSSSSRASSPPPGVDRELYELTISKMETNIVSSHLEDTFNRLMSTTEQTSITPRNSIPDDELSAEADRVIVELPDLSFMLAKFLMFPSVLTPKYTETLTDSNT